VPDRRGGSARNRKTEQGHELIVHLLAERSYAEHYVVGEGLLGSDLVMTDLFGMEPRTYRRR
jgi:hypothetical protein